MPGYDNLIKHLTQNPQCDRKTALELMSYPYEATKHNTLDRLVKGGTLSRVVMNGKVYYSLKIQKVEFDLELPFTVEAQKRIHPHNYMSLYRFSVRYAQNYFASPARIRWMAAVRRFINSQWSYLQFARHLHNLVNNPPSMMAYGEIRKDLINAKWDTNTEYDPMMRIEEAIALMYPTKHCDTCHCTPFREHDYLGIPVEGWNSLTDITDTSTLTINLEGKTNDDR